MTPNDIEVLIHCHVSLTPHPRRHYPAVRESLEMFTKHGFIEPIKPGDFGFEKVDKEAYRTTDRGRAWIAMLCATPWPEQAWVDARGEVIEI